MKAKKIKIDTITTMYSNKIKIILHYVKLTTYCNVKGNIQMTSYSAINNNESQND